MTPPAAPHDALFKTFLTHPETAREFFDIHLPKSLRALCDLATLRLESGSFIEPTLRSAHSDILYSLKTAQGDGYIYCLVEHQSTPDPLMPFRLMRYSILAMQSHLDKGHRTLPLVIPTLFHQGPTPCLHNACWLDNFTHPEAARALYGTPFPLVDMTAIPDDKILEHKGIALLELAQKHARQDAANVVEPLERLAPAIRSRLFDSMTREQLSAWVSYVVDVGNATDPRILAKRLVGVLSNDDKENVMATIAEYLRTEGREAGLMEGLKKGHTEGHTEGRAEGRTEGEAAMLVRLLSRRFGPLPEWARERLRRADVAQLETWADAVLDATTLAEVVGAPPNPH